MEVMGGDDVCSLGEEGDTALDQEVEEEEEEEQQEEEFDRQQFGIYQCLPVDGREPDWESGEAQTVEEYLRRVRYEAERLPTVVSSGLSPEQLAEQQEQQEGGSGFPAVALSSVPQCAPELKPSPAWVRHFLAQFADLRRRLQREQELLAAAAEGAAHEAAVQQQMAALSLEGGGAPSSLMPELQQLSGKDQVAVSRELGAAGRRALRREEGLTPEDAASLYALSARVEKPLHADVAALYRALVRRTATLRASLPGPQHPLLPHLNIVLAVAGGYFGQDEELAGLWEEDEED